MQTPVTSWQRSRPLAHVLFLAVLLASGLFYLLVQARPTEAAADLTVEIIAAYNLVVDSNVESPSTYAPSVATVAGRFCNVGDTPLTNAQGYIGDGTTPGTYPARDSTDSSFTTQHPHLANTGNYAFTHVGGQLGTADASRFIGTILPGECRLQYWHFTYPRRANPNNSGTAVWGQTNVPQDDLWLNFVIWGAANGETGSDTNNSAARRMTMRNEISAMANKIRPNPDGQWFNTNTSVVAPGDVITSNGILYELGVVRHGFDNDGDFVPDYNAWVQPIGDPNYDPSCFRLIRTTGVVTVSRSAGQLPLIISFDDQDPALSAPYGGPLYFTNLPDDNNGVRGEVFYTFMALDGPCSTGLSPYQEVASGYDNEKFNGDYGTGIPPVASSAPQVTLNKTSAPTSIPLGSTTTYNIPFANVGTAGFGLGFSTGGSMPLVIEDTVPQGMQYVGGSAAATLTFTPNTGVTIRYSTDSGVTWTLADPGTVTSNGPNNLVMVQWWLNDTLPAGSTGNFATFQATVPLAYTGTPFIENCAQASLGGGTPFAEACTTNVVPGNNSIGNFVWRDEDADGIQDGGAETGIANIGVTLYYDVDGDGVLDDTDPQVAAVTTNGFGGYSFSNLPDGRYIVVVDHLDNDLPSGYANTTTRSYAVALDPTSSTTTPVNFDTADFGFGPSLRVVKTLTSLNPAYVGETVTFDIDLTNTLPGDGTAQGFCTYTIWATIDHPNSTFNPPGGNAANAQWVNTANALFDPDGAYAATVMNDNTDLLGLSGFNRAGQVGNITSVRFVAYAREINNLKDTDQFVVRVWDTPGGVGAGAALAAYSYTGLAYFTGAAGSNYIVTQDITGLRAPWNWSHFAGNVTEMQLEGNRGGGAGNSGDIGLDAAGYVVTTDQLCGGADTTISYLPLVDTYNPAQLQFISADPMPSSTTPAGTLTWDNLGPLYAGGTRRISLQFRALTAVAAPGTLNTATVTNPEFMNGRNANNGTDNAQVPILVSGSIAGTVWADTNNSGWNAPTGHNAGDSRLPNVLVRLYGCISNFTGQIVVPPVPNNQSCTDISGTWQLLATSRTATDGTYLFSGLRDGFYNVTVDDTTLPANFTFNRAEATQPGNGTGASCPGGAAPCDDQWSLPDDDLDTFNNIVNGATGENITNVSFGYLNTTTNGAIVGYVWHDVDQDGVWDAGEQPISGITVYLCLDTANPCNAGNAIATTTTDANGFYSFERAPGNYRVGVLMPNGMSQSGDPDASGANCGGSCDNQSNGFTLVAHEVEGPRNFGYSGGLSIGDTIYADWNGDGDQDAGEEGISGVTVYLYRDSNSNGVLEAGEPLLATDVTAANGLYQFDNLPGNGNDYLVVVNEATLPAGYMQTGDPGEAGTCVVCDGRHPVELTTASIFTVDFGYQPQGFGSIGDTVWHDTNANGVQEAGEAPANGVVVNLYQDQNGNGILDPEDAFVATDTTDASGLYGFTGLAAGNYIVQVAAANFGVGQELAGETLTNSGATYNAGQNSHQVALAAGGNYTDADFGYTSSAVGDFVWRDNNGDGNQDSGEPGIPGVTVYLCVSEPCNSGTAVATTTTDTDGYYAFTGLLPRTVYSTTFYVVAVDTTTLPTGYSQTGDPDLTTVCSGPTCDSSSRLTLALGQTDRSRDFGYRPLGVIGDTLWVDDDNDGIRDTNESGIAGVTIYLCTGSPCNSGTAVLTTTTDINGYYSFADLDDNTYFVGVESTQIPANLTQTYDADGTINGEGANIEVSGGVVTSIGGNACTGCDLNVDFGYRFTGAFNINGTVFFDPNDNATQDPTETYGYPSVTMYLWYCGTDNNCSTTGDNRYIGSTSTNGTGDYSFTNLPAGTYSVSVNRNAPNLIGLDPTLTSGPITFRSVTIGPDANDVDFGFLSSIDLGDLPDSYRTTMNADGPRHAVTTTLYLGETVAPDVDPNGQDSLAADGDDSDTIDDEDGVLQSSGGGGAYHWGAGTGYVDIDVVGTGCLVAWVDWNRNGTFDTIPTIGGVSELVLLQSVNNLANQQLTFTSPTSADYGNTYPTELFARFRLFPPHDARFSNMTVDGNGCPTAANGQAALNNLVGGVAEWGEVEDYRFQFFGPTAVNLVQISTTFEDVAGLFVLPMLLLVVITAAAALVLYRRKLV